MLVAGAGAHDTPADGGALTFGANSSQLWVGWDAGSAEKHIGLY